MKNHKLYLQKNAVSYEELMSMPNDTCIKISRAYFYYLMAKQGFLKIEHPQIHQIFSKYIELERMIEFLNGSPSISRYYIMTVEDIRYLLNVLKDTPSAQTFLLKSNVKSFELEERYKALKEIVSLKQINCSEMKKNLVRTAK